MNLHLIYFLIFNITNIFAFNPIKLIRKPIKYIRKPFVKQLKYTNNTVSNNIIESLDKSDQVSNVSSNIENTELEHIPHNVYSSNSNIDNRVKIDWLCAIVICSLVVILRIFSFFITLGYNTRLIIDEKLNDLDI